MTDLSEITTKQLEVELSKRKEAEKRLGIPSPSSAPDFKALIGLCEQYIKDLSVEGYADEDFDHWIFESAMEAVYGKEVWLWINKHYT